MLKAHRLLPALLAVAVLGTASACAAQGGYGRYPGYPSNPNSRVDDRAYQQGYQDGRLAGEEDSRRGRNFDYNRHREYRNASSGYGNGRNTRNDSRSAFRQGSVPGRGSVPLTACHHTTRSREHLRSAGPST